MAPIVWILVVMFVVVPVAAAVARQTGSEVIVPPSPGMVGALGIALLALRERRLDLLLLAEAWLGRRVPGQLGRHLQQGVQPLPHGVGRIHEDRRRPAWEAVGGIRLG